MVAAAAAARFVGVEATENEMMKIVKLIGRQRVYRLARHPLSGARLVWARNDRLRFVFWSQETQKVQIARLIVNTNF